MPAVGARGRCPRSVTRGRSLGRHRRPNPSTLVAATLGILLFSITWPTEARADHLWYTANSEARGFDRCELPSRSAMRDWWVGTDFYWFGLYLGGANFGTGCSKADYTWANDVHDIGYRFAPIWVGRQSKCWPGSGIRISNDRSTARQQGRDAATNAADAARSISIDKGVIYYDLEHHTGSNECRLAARSFVNGWVERLTDVEDFTAGVYGSAEASYLDDFDDIDRRPRAIWGARENGTKSVFDLDPYVPDSHWENHGRLRQYMLDVVRKHGATEMKVDLNCAYGPIIPDEPTPSNSACY